MQYMAFCTEQELVEIVETFQSRKVALHSTFSLEVFVALQIKTLQASWELVQRVA